MSTLTPAAQRILAAAGQLFYHEGIHAVGVERVAEVAGTTKKTLYDRFGSKDALVAAYLDQRREAWTAYAIDYVAKRGTDPRTQVLATFDALATWQQRNGDRGCAFINAYAEITDSRHPGLAVISAEKQWVRRHYARLVRACEVRDAARVGKQVALLHEGAIVVSSAGSMRGAIRLARDTAGELIDAARD